MCKQKFLLLCFSLSAAVASVGAQNYGSVDIYSVQSAPYLALFDSSGISHALQCAFPGIMSADSARVSVGYLPQSSSAVRSEMYEHNTWLSYQFQRSTNRLFAAAVFPPGRAQTGIGFSSPQIFNASNYMASARARSIDAWIWQRYPLGIIRGVSLGLEYWRFRGSDTISPHFDESYYGEKVSAIPGAHTNRTAVDLNLSSGELRQLGLFTVGGRYCTTAFSLRDGRLDLDSDSSYYDLPLADSAGEHRYDRITGYRMNTKSSRFEEDSVGYTGSVGYSRIFDLGSVLLTKASLRYSTISGHADSLESTEYYLVRQPDIYSQNLIESAWAKKIVYIDFHWDFSYALERQISRNFAVVGSLCAAVKTGISRYADDPGFMEKGATLFDKNGSWEWSLASPLFFNWNPLPSFTMIMGWSPELNSRGYSTTMNCYTDWRSPQMLPQRYSHSQLVVNRYSLALKYAPNKRFSLSAIPILDGNSRFSAAYIGVDCLFR